MAISRFKSQMAYNDFYRKFYQPIVYLQLGTIVSVLIFVFFTLYQVAQRPLPSFHAKNSKGGVMQLSPFDEPNQLPTTITRWARKAAITAYTFNFSRIQEDLALARPYFTPAGWADYQRSVTPLLQTITEKKLIVNGVIIAPPVFSNQGLLPGSGYTWKVQIPFLVAYETSERTYRQYYTVILTIVKIPTSINPTGIGIDQFVMI